MYDTDLDDDSRPRFYLLTMYPYPSGALHIGHWYIKTPTDAIARYRRMHGDNVFLPIGFDAYGLPAENAAIKNGINPREWTMANIEKMRGQLRSMGASFAWDSEVVTCEPEFYVWNQWLFLQFLKHGPGLPRRVAGRLVPQRRHARARAGRGHRPPLLALRREGREARARRSGTCRPPNYADELLDFSGIDWPDPIRIMQTNWIGRSSGAEIVFETAPSPHHAGGEELRVFTTRPDTLFGATFMVLAPEHPLVAELTAPDRKAEVEAYVKATAAEDRDRPPVDRPREDRRADRRRRDQPGQRRADPDLRRRLRAGHVRHRRDHGRPGPRRARLRVRARSTACRSCASIMPSDGDPDEVLTEAFVNKAVDEAPADDRKHGWLEDLALINKGTDAARELVMVNSGPWDGKPAIEAWGEIVEALEEQGKGSDAVTYRLRDWLVSRQRYWGTPIPVIHCPTDGPVPVPESDLPVLLPDDGRLPRVSGENPLNRDEAFLNVDVPAVRRAGQARDRHPGHVHRLVVVLVPLPVAAQGGRAGRHRHGPRVVAGRPVHGRRRARRDAPAVQPVLHQGDARPRPGHRERAVPQAVQPGPDPGRRRRADEQEPRATSRTRTSWSRATAPTRSGCS